MSLSTPRPSGRWNADYASMVLDDLDDSGLTLADFARQEGLDTQRIRFWRKQLDRLPRARPRIVELVLTGSETTTSPAPVATAVRVQCPTGHVLEIVDLPADQALVAVLRALRTVAC